jgi:hypothetical protein
MGRHIRLVAILAIGAALITALPVDAATSGGKCPKAGRVQTTNSVKYKCTKSGKVLKWVKVAPTATSTSAITTSTSVTAKDGDSCSTVGDKSTVSSGYLECRTISGGTNKWFKLSASPVAVSVPAGGSSLDACKLTEARINKFQPWNVGFPRGASGSTMLPSTGVSNVQLIAIDFSDAVGTADELSAADTQISEFNKWFEFNSNGAKSFNWQYPKRWFRMSKPVPDYGFRKGDWSKTLPSVQEMVSLADPYIDFTNSDWVFVLLPKSIRLSDPDIPYINPGITSAEGPVKNLFGGADYFYRNNYDLWSLWIHEWGHPMGLPGHSPRSNLSIMDNQNGSSVMLNVWDTFFAGWMGADQLYCMPNSATTLETQLIPLERLQHGMRGVVVPISTTEALVVESHRAEGWGSKLGAGTYGVLVYYIDTTKDTDRSGESFGIVGEAWSKYVTLSTTDSNSLLLQGDTVIYKGITVTLTKTGDVDTVRITK